MTDSTAERPRHGAEARAEAGDPGVEAPNTAEAEGPSVEDAVLVLRGVVVRRGNTVLVGPIDWTVRRNERWVVLGPNGSGKTTLLRIASSYLWPSEGRVDLLGRELGTVDARDLRRRVGYVSAALAPMLADELRAVDVVMTARHGALGPWWHAYDERDRIRAADLLDRLGCRALAERAFGTLSTGERQRVQIARALMASPDLLLLDEPAAGLDLGAREALVERLHGLAADGSVPALVLVTHHVEEIPPGFTHALLLREGRAVSAGPIGGTITSAALSMAFDMRVRLERRDGRFAARGEGRSAAG